MKILFSLFILGSSVSWADHQEKPAHCLREFEAPCAVWAFKKGHFPMPGVQIFTAADTLFEWRGESIYLVQGSLWVLSEKTIRVETRFGAVRSDGKNEIWVSANDEFFKISSLGKVLQVEPRSRTPITIPLSRGFEIRLSYVDPATHSADVSGPTLMNLPAQVRAINTIVPNEEVLRQKASQAAAVIMANVKTAAQNEHMKFDRTLASVKRQELRLKYEAEAKSGRDSYLRELFRRKSNFAE